MPRFQVIPRDVPAEHAAKRLGMKLAEFRAALPNLMARGFPAPDPDTHNFDLTGIDRWCDARNPHLFGGDAAGMGARDAATCVNDRIAALRNRRG